MSLRRKIREQAKTHSKLTQKRAKVWNAGKYKEDEILGQKSYVEVGVVCGLLDKATEQILFRLRTFVKTVPVDMAISLVEQELGAEAEAEKQK